MNNIYVGKIVNTFGIKGEVKVTLYTSDGQIATLLSDPNESGISEEKLMHKNVCCASLKLPFFKGRSPNLISALLSTDNTPPPLAET